MDKIISKIKEEMELQGLTTPKLLQKIGIVEEKEIRKTNRFLSGDRKRLDMDFVLKLATALNIVKPVTAILSASINVSPVPGKMPIVEEHYQEYISMPVHTLAGAGEPCCLETSEPIEYLKVDPRYDGVNISVIKIRGRSMEPIINDGGYVGIDRTDKTIVSGEMFALWLPHEGAVVKRIWMMPDMIRIGSDNPSAPAFDIPLHRIDWDTFVLGRVKWVLQSY